MTFDVTLEETVFDVTEIAENEFDVTLENVIYDNSEAIKIRVANSAPSNPDEGDVYVDSVENALYLATD